MNFRDFLVDAAAKLEPYTDTPALEARVLLSHHTNRPLAFLLAHPEIELTSEQLAALEADLQRRCAGVPLPYILGRWDFFGHEFIVSPDVLIPRPETELLIETALAYVRGKGISNPNIIDIGTGSGIIPVTLALELPKAQLTATDISPAALDVAQRNAEKHVVAERIRFVEHDLFPEGDERFDLILSNPPYIPTKTMLELEVYGREPTLALDGGADGLDIIRCLLEQAAGRLKSPGLMLVEIEAGQGHAIQPIARKAFPTSIIKVLKDLAGKDRLAYVETNLA